MGVLVWLLPVSAATIVHGAVQAASTGARWVFPARTHAVAHRPALCRGRSPGRRGVRGRDTVPEPGVVLMLIGAFPWLARARPRTWALDISRPVTACVCGAVVTAAQLFAGASGPLLDAFYLAHAARPLPGRRQQGLHANARAPGQGRLLWDPGRRRGCRDRRVGGAAGRRLPGRRRGRPHWHPTARSGERRPLSAYQRLPDPGPRRLLLRERRAGHVRVTRHGTL